MTQNSALTSGKPLGEWTATREDLSLAAAPIRDAIASSEQFCLWLMGDLGAGKTTVTGAILRALGLDPDFPVTSPTFTYLNEYRIGERWYAHIDLYRAGAGFSLEELGFVDSRRFSGYFIEWPSALEDTDGVLPATHILEILQTQDPNERTFRLFKATK